ncbi:hypothetical protein PIIN_08731 [Serendipita indica DSM 11827]|uniref:Uncharacterized protein n=1 Tax=Serendipita indica (strain DSM 11827) TaxID=1109443 RepID=G4TTY0_SERID|nr:hypothetical protein PIIN_08731 [Serendipita indica DSM 11827]
MAPRISLAKSEDAAWLVYSIFAARLSDLSMVCPSRSKSSMDSTQVPVRVRFSRQIRASSRPWAVLTCGYWPPRTDFTARKARTLRVELPMLSELSMWIMIVGTNPR